MKDLMTRKIILGLLMTLVLGFGVQSVVDAVKDPKLKQSSSDFFKFRTPNTTFSISTGILSFDDSASAETVTIVVSGGITLTDAFLGESGTITLTESDADGQQADNGSYFTTTPNTDGSRFGRSLSIKGRFNNDASGEQTVAISSTGWESTYTYYYYVSATAGTSTSIIQLTNGTGALTFFDASSGSGYAEGDFGDADIQIYAGDTNHLPVRYSPSSRLQMSHTNFESGKKVNLPSGDISSTFAIHLKKNTSTDVVTAQVRGPDTPIITGVYIYGYPTLEVDAPTGRSQKGSEENPAQPGEVIANAFTATVKDGLNRGVPGVPVQFMIPTDSATNGELGFGSGNTGTLVDTSNQLIFDGNTQITAGTGTTLYVRTNSSGKASVNCRLITGNVPITVTAVGESDSDAMVYTTAASGKQLTALSTRRSLTNSDAYDLFVLVTYNGEPVDPSSPPTGTDAAEFNVIFRTGDGNFGNTNPNTKTTATPNSDGIAQVRFTPNDSSSNPQVTASLEETNQGVTRAVDTVTFDVTSGAPTSRDPAPPPPQPARLDISVFGEDGDTSRAVIVNALNSVGQAVSISIPITLSGTALATSQTVNTGAATTITPPTDPDTYTLIATDPAGNYASDTETITVGGPAGEGTLNVTTVGVPVNNQQTIEVTVEDADGDAPAGEVVVTLTGPGISRTVDTFNGTGRAIITLPDTATYTLELSADGYATREVTLSVSGIVQDDTETRDTTTTPGGEADSVRIANNPFPSGTANRQLAQPLRVQVLDANGNGVANVRVTFKLVSGQGRLSQRGDGSGIRAQTDSSGNASANYTPLADGTSRVRATAAGVTQTVTFTITAGAAAPSTEETTPSETGVTPSREINPVVQVNASQRPPMLWVDGGSIYALVGADVQEFASGVEGAMNIAVGGGKVYWTEKTGESAGTINSANLNGSNVQELASILAVPMGIAVSGDKLYWTNSRGRIQSANLDGSDITTVLPNLPGPMDIAVARGNLYWTQYDATTGTGNIGIVNPNSAQKIARYTSTGSDAPGSLTVSGGKVYWTEMTGDSSGTINSANLNGTNATQLASILAVPSGISVDGSRSQLYWTNSRGRIQRANLDGSKIQNVVSGLGSPGDMVSSNSIAAPVATPPTTPTTPTASNKYDVNGDGSVDNMDAGLVADALGTTNAKYDVNGDGSVNFLDLLLVFDNRDDGAAGAPTVLGMQMTAAQVDILQEQIDLLIATGDRSPAAMRTLIYLQQLIATARPEKTQLLANYPNPFNPETWIPYELATDTTVKITIYNTQGVVIRTLEFGHQAAGYYTGRDRAAYWDGRNAFGEQVASGIYFYQFETDDMSSMRKMVILK